MKINVIVPVFNGGEKFDQCLQAIKSSQRPPDKVTIVDDGSTDNGVDNITRYGFKKITLSDGPGGPARARNLGASDAADMDILVFVDADVVIYPNTIGSIEQCFDADGELAAVFGSYDDKPAESDIVSRYKNLLHHHIHQSGCQEATTFWAGCGAIRKDIFVKIGGFNGSYTKPSIEDIDLGVRLSTAGYRIQLRREILATHLKKWTLGNLIMTDIFARAVPWSKLIVQYGDLMNDLNLTIKHRVAAICAVLITLLLMIVFWAPSPILLLGLIVVAIFVILNRDLIRLFHRVGGFRLAIGGSLLHWLYYNYSLVTFVIVRSIEVFKRFRYS